MVHNKLSVIFILIASAIAPVVAPPPPVTSHNVHGSPIAHGPPRPPGHSSPPSHPSPESPHNPSPHRTSQIEGSSSNPGQASSSSSKIPSSGERKFEFINYSENDKGKTVETGKRTKVPRAEHGFDPSSNSGHYIEDSSYKPTTKKGAYQIIWLKSQTGRRRKGQFLEDYYRIYPHDIPEEPKTPRKAKTERTKEDKARIRKEQAQIRKRKAALVERDKEQFAEEKAQVKQVRGLSKTAAMAAKVANSEGKAAKQAEAAENLDAKLAEDRKRLDRARALVPPNAPEPNTRAEFVEWQNSAPSDHSLSAKRKMSDGKLGAEGSSKVTKRPRLEEIEAAHALASLLPPQ